MDMWMKMPEKFAGSGAALFRSRADVLGDLTVNFRTSADEFCRIYLDGEIICRAPERGSRKYWYQTAGELHLSRGSHTLYAEVFALGKDMTAYAQESVEPGFFWQDDDGIFSCWECRILDEVKFSPSFPDWGAYPRVQVSAGYAEIFNCGNWENVRFRLDPRELHARDLPEMRYEKIDFRHRDGNLIRFDRYVTAFGEYRFRGCGKIRMRWAETGYIDGELDPATLCGNKGDRTGKLLFGTWDEFTVNGEYCWRDIHYHAGKVLEIVTDGTAEIAGMTFYQTGYPWKFKKLPQLSPSERKFAEMALLTIQSCTHETFMDCPYYEQLMYIGDTRIIARVLYSLTDDLALTEKALRFFALSAGENGMLLSRCPSKKDQFIPVYSLIYVLMAADYAAHGGKAELLRQLLNTTRKIVEMPWPQPGWQFIDWVDGWERGVPPGDGALRWFQVLALEAQSELEKLYGNADLADKYAANAADNVAELLKNYRDVSGLFADTPGGTYFSEHAQVLALLSKNLPAENAREILAAMRKNRALAETSSYFSFYYLQAMQLHGETELFEQRMKRYREFAAAGLDTTPETFGNPRSDCHAWSAHPLLFMLERNKISQ